jgi:mannose-6-phosphate isomerase
MKIITKPWGYEFWLTDETTPYSMKRIILNAGQRTSLQVHRYKVETTYIVSGSAILLLSEEDAYDFTNGNIPPLTEQYIEAGSTFDIKPGTVHRITAITDLEFIESSSTELDDVIRLQDDTNRKDGKIASEHKS